MSDESTSLRILIVRLSHIGDCLLTIPLAFALREAFPRATIGWATEPPSDQLLACVPEVDQVLALPRKWSRSVSGWMAARRIVRNFAPDVTLDPQSLTKSAGLAALSGAPTRIGLARPEGRELAPWLATGRIAATKPHLVDRTLELLHGLNRQPDKPKWNLVLPSAGQEFAETLVREEEFASPFVVINPGGTWPAKRWLPGRFAEVATLVHRDRGVRSLVVWAGDEERRWAEEIASRAPGAAVLAPKTSLVQLAAILQKAAFYLGGDSGPMHLSQAMGTPCVALFGPTLPSRCGPYGPDHITLQRYYQEGSCRERRSAPNDALRAIDVAEVYEACLRLLERIDQSARREAA
ncbi:MAG TPA: glycosyltransferase family 9 protein [Pirellulaceae bacterium]|jgi:ADP-heptose:LPS heptosyltransferase|nr:glycosyltransferase family 9 protein [Pirellulaceae bacterium]